MGDILATDLKRDTYSRHLIRERIAAFVANRIVITGMLVKDSSLQVLEPTLQLVDVFSMERTIA